MSILDLVLIIGMTGLAFVAYSSAVYRRERDTRLMAVAWGLVFVTGVSNALPGEQGLLRIAIRTVADAGFAVCLLLACCRLVDARAPRWAIPLAATSLIAAFCFSVQGERFLGSIVSSILIAPLPASACVLVYRAHERSGARVGPRLLAAALALVTVLTLFDSVLMRVLENGQTLAIGLWTMACAGTASLQLVIFLERARAQADRVGRERDSALRRTVDELERSKQLASMGTLLAGIAHQIKNPLGSIRLGTELALRDEANAGLPEDAREALENALEQSERCGDIVSNLLAFARNEPTTKSSQPINALVGRLRDQTLSFAAERRAEVVFHPCDEDPAVFVSTIELDQAILNVLRNAIESLEDCGRVELRVLADDERVSIVVTDEGCGMSRQTLERAREAFYTTRAESGGTGLGLSLAHRIIEDHGGRLELESEVGRGTVVTITLPRSDMADTPAHETYQHEPAPTHPNVFAALGR